MAVAARAVCADARGRAERGRVMHMEDVVERKQTFDIKYIRIAGWSFREVYQIALECRAWMEDFPGVGMSPTYG